MGFISSRLRRGFLSVLQLVIARAVLDTSSWRVEVDPKWVVQHGQTDCPCKTAHIQPGPRPPTAPEAAPAVLLAIVTVGCHSHTKEEGCAAHSSTFFFLDRNFSLPCDDSGEG